MDAADLDRYTGQLAALLPTGLAWPRAPDTVLQKLLTAWANEMALVDARANELIIEANPAEALALLTDWARVTDVPDSCFTGTVNAAQLRTMVLDRLLSLTIPTPGYFVDLAASMGFTVTVTEFRQSTVEDGVESYINDEPWAHVWQVNTALNGTISPMSVEDDVESFMESWNNNAALECAINRAKPAHTTVIFSYT